MTRSVALRASICFVIVTLALGAMGLSSHAVVAEIGFLVGASLVALLAFFASAPAPQAIPVRVRRTAHRRDARY